MISPDRLKERQEEAKEADPIALMDEAMHARKAEALLLRDRAELLALVREQNAALVRLGACACAECQRIALPIHARAKPWLTEGT